MVATKEKKEKKVAKEKKKSTKPVGFMTLVKMVSAHPSSAALLKTAITQGVLTNLEFATRLEESEIDKIREIVADNKLVKAAQPADISALPKECGSFVNEFRGSGGKRVKFSACGKDYSGDGLLFEYFKKRHPDAKTFISVRGSELMFSGRNTVAVMPITVVEAEEGDAPAEKSDEQSE